MLFLWNDCEINVIIGPDLAVYSKKVLLRHLRWIEWARLPFHTEWKCQKENWWYIKVLQIIWFWRNSINFILFFHLIIRCDRAWKEEKVVDKLANTKFYTAPIEMMPKERIFVKREDMY